MAGIIKANGSSTPSGSASDVAFNFDDLTTKAQDYLEGVRAEGTRLIEEAKQQAEQVRQQAEVAGRAAAEESARKNAEATALASLDQRLQTLLPALETAVVGIQQAKEEWRERWERNVISLATAIAGRVLRRELTAESDIPLTFLREAMELAAGAQQLKVLLHPEDHTALGEQAKQIIAAISRAGDVEILPDPTIERGGCIVRTEFGEIDQQIETQLARIEQELS